MTLTVRTDPATELALTRFAARTKRTKSDVVKQALNEFLQKQAVPAPSTWDLMKDLIEDVEANYEKHGSPLPSDLAQNRKKYLDEYYAQRHARRRGSVDRRA